MNIRLMEVFRERDEWRILEREMGLVEVVASHIKSNLFDWRFCREKGLNIRGI